MRLFAMALALAVLPAAAPPTNPVVSGDWSDPAIVRVGDHYYTMRSSFGFQPGLPIMQSDDLVNWRYIGFVYDTHPLIASGVTATGSWGAELGYNPNTKSFVVYTPIDRYIRAYTSRNPGGPYRGPYDLGLRGIDPGFFADDDGRLYLIYHEGKIVELARDGLSVKREVTSVGLGRGVAFEGPSIAKHGGYYYVLYSSGGTRPHQHSAISTARARRIEGPWEPCPHNPQLQADDNSGSQFQGPAHGTLIRGPDGRWYVTYHAFELTHYSLGRQMCIEPIEWTDDGWWRPVHGRTPSPEAPIARRVPDGSDEFDKPELGPQWFFLTAPDRSGMSWTLRERPGFLRIKAQPGDLGDKSALTGVFLQRLTLKRFSVVTQLNFRARSPGEAAGIHFFHDPGMNFWLASTFADGRPAFEIGRYDNAKRDILHSEPNIIGSRVRLMIRVDGEETASFYVSAVDGPWCRIGPTVYFGDSWHDLRSGRGGSPDLGWVGIEKRNVWTAATMGVFAVRGQSESQVNADFDWFRIVPR